MARSQRNGANAISAYLPKYLPGNPNVIIQNVAGTAGLIATNQVYNLVKPDDLLVGAIHPRSTSSSSPSGRSDIRLEEVYWIASMASSNTLIYIRNDTGIKPSKTCA